MENIKEIDLKMSGEVEDYFECQRLSIEQIANIFGLPPSLLTTLPSKWWHKFVIFRPKLSIDQIVYL